ncbi:hypothetical protein [Nesterenkonia populi]
MMDVVISIALLGFCAAGVMSFGRAAHKGTDRRGILTAALEAVLFLVLARTMLPASAFGEWAWAAAVAAAFAVVPLAVQRWQGLPFFVEDTGRWRRLAAYASFLFCLAAIALLLITFVGP